MNGSASLSLCSMFSKVVPLRRWLRLMHISSLWWWSLWSWTSWSGSFLAWSSLALLLIWKFIFTVRLVVRFNGSSSRSRFWWALWFLRFFSEHLSISVALLQISHLLLGVIIFLSFELILWNVFHMALRLTSVTFSMITIVMISILLAVLMASSPLLEVICVLFEIVIIA